MFLLQVTVANIINSQGKKKKKHSIYQSVSLLVLAIISNVSMWDRQKYVVVDHGLELPQSPIRLLDLKENENVLG